MQTRDMPAERFELRRMLRTTFRHRCPACGRGALYEGVYAIRSACPCCGVRFERNPGNWTGPVVLAYGVGTVTSFAAGFALYLAWGVFPGLEAVMIAVAFAAALGTYRLVKSWWIWLLWATGLVFADAPGGDGTRRV